MIRLIFVCSLALLSVLFVQQQSWSQVTPGRQLPSYKITTSQFGLDHSQGVHPFKVILDLVPAKPAGNDQEYLVKVNTLHQFGFSSITTGVIRINAGNTSGSVELMLPASGFIENSMIEVRESGAAGNLNGRLLFRQSIPIEGNDKQFAKLTQKKLLVGNTNTPEFGNNVSMDNRQIWLIKGLSNTKQLSLKQPMVVDVGPAISLRKYRRNFNNQIATVKSFNLPENWLGLSGFDQIFLSSGELKTLVETSETQRGNLEKWVAAGGALVIYSAGADYRDTDKVLGWLLGKFRASKLLAGGMRWSEPVGVSTQADVNCAVRAAGSGLSGKNVLHFDTSLSLKQLDNPRALDPDLFGFLPYLNGCIISVDDDMSTWNRGDWRRLENSIVLNGSSLPARIGSGSGIFPVLAIPGVGEPPELLFKILLSLFLITAGPVALIAFSKLGKPHLLLVVIPLLSMMVSLALFSFVLIGDGLIKTGSVQSVTTLDQRTNLAVISCRASYFSNFTSKPYEFSSDTLVGLTSGNGEVRNFEQRDDQMRVYGKALMARTLHELSTLQVRPASQKLVLNFGETAGSGLPNARNDLGAKVVFAIFRNDNDEYFLLEDLDSGLSKRVEKIQLKSKVKLSDYAGGLIRKDKKEIYSNNLNRRFYFPISESEISYGDTEAVLYSAKVSSLLSRPNSYVAFLEDLPLVTDDLESVHYKKQNHVVLGRW